MCVFVCVFYRIMATPAQCHCCHIKRPMVTLISTKIARREFLLDSLHTSLYSCISADFHAVITSFVLCPFVCNLPLFKGTADITRMRRALNSCARALRSFTFNLCTPNNAHRCNGRRGGAVGGAATEAILWLKAVPRRCK